MKEKRMVNEYEIIHSVWIGDREVVLGQKEVEEPQERYLCAFCEANEILEAYEDGYTGNYLEMMQLFCERIQAQIEQVKREQEKITVQNKEVTPEQCYVDNRSSNIQGKIMAVKPSSLRPEYRTADKQLVFVTGGFGSYGAAHGSAVYCINLYSGKTTRWERYDMLGEVKEECLPEWARERSEIIRIMENQTKATRETGEQSRTNEGYKILRSVQVGNTEFVLGENPKAPEPYVTWGCRDKTGYYFGHYFKDEETAWKDFIRRVTEEKQFKVGMGRKNEHSPQDQER